MSNKRDLLDSDVDSDGSDDGGLTLTVNKRYAQAYDDRKRKQELSRARDLGLLDGDEDAESESTSESEDEGDGLSALLDIQILKTIAMIKAKDPRVYDPATKFYDEENPEPVEAAEAPGSKSKKMTAKDVIRKHVEEAVAAGKSDAFDDDEDLEAGGSARAKLATTAKLSALVYDKEQQSLRDEFKKAVKAKGDAVSSSSESEADGGEDDEDEDSFLRVKPKSKEELAEEEMDLKQALEKSKVVAEKLGEDGKLSVKRYLEAPPEDDADKFLREFSVARAWRAAGEGEDGVPPAPSSDEEEVEAQEAFEAKYNFRFESAEGGEIIGHARKVEGSIRRLDDSRKRKRATKALKKLEQKAEEEKELRRLKNLQREEMKAQLKQLAEVAGNGVDLNELAAALEGDFDPDEFSAKMAAAFADAYSDADDEFDPTQGDPLADLSADEEGEDAVHAAVKGGSDDDDDDDSEDEEDEEEEEAVRGKGAAGASAPSAGKIAKAVRVVVPSLPAPAPKKGLPFAYKKVKPNDYGLTAAEILELEDKQLNKLVSLKKLAPYREKDHKVSKTAQRKKVEQLLKEVGRGKRRKESRAAPPAPAGADSAEPSPVAASVAKAATPSAPAAAVDGDAGGKKKKTRRSKKKHVKGEE